MGLGTLCPRSGAACAPRSPERSSAKPGPVSSAQTHVAAGSVPSVPLCQPCLTFQQWHSGSSGCAALLQGPWGRLSSAATATHRGKIIFSAPSLHPLFQSGAFLEPQGRKGHGLASLPPSAPALSFCSSRWLCLGALTAPVPAPFFLLLPKYPGPAASVGKQGGKKAFVRADVWAGELQSPLLPTEKLAASTEASTESQGGAGEGDTGLAGP